LEKTGSSAIIPNTLFAEWFFFERRRAAVKTVCVLRNGTFLVVLHVVLLGGTWRWVNHPSVQDWLLETWSHDGIGMVLVVCRHWHLQSGFCWFCDGRKQKLFRSKKWEEKLEVFVLEAKAEINFRNLRIYDGEWSFENLNWWLDREDFVG
jgi:hypothetical protein